jgi:hypothetical protein
MSGRAARLLRLAPLVLSLALVGCEKAMQDMYRQPRYDPLEPSTLFPDGSSARTPVAETLAAIGGRLADASGGTHGTQVPALYPHLEVFPVLDIGTPQTGGGAEVRAPAEIPFPLTAATYRRGRERFAIYCAPCHSAVGGRRRHGGPARLSRPAELPHGPPARGAGPSQARSGVGLILLVATTSLAAFDWVMSLDPLWYSAVLGLLVCAAAGGASAASPTHRQPRCLPGGEGAGAGKLRLGGPQGRDRPDPDRACNRDPDPTGARQWRGGPMTRIPALGLAACAWLALGTVAAIPEHLFQRGRLRAAARRDAPPGYPAARPKRAPSPDTEQIARIATRMRWLILSATGQAGSGHPTSSLSAVELMSDLLFGGFFRYRIEELEYPNNDRLIFSKGHASPLLYALWTAAGESLPSRTKTVFTARHWRERTSRMPSRGLAKWTTKSAERSCRGRTGSRSDLSPLTGAQHRIIGSDGFVLDQKIGEFLRTLLFSLSAYEAVAEAYLRALERRAGDGRDLRSVASVASFFLSRIDVLTDKLLGQRIRVPSASIDPPPPERLLDRAAVANAKLAYRSFKRLFSGEERWRLMVCACSACSGRPPAPKIH